MLLPMILSHTVHGQPPAEPSQGLVVFSTPEQRLLLDRLRTNYLATLSREEALQVLLVPPNLPPLIEEEIADEGAEVIDEVELEPLLLRLEGVVQHRDGSYTVWMNGRAIVEARLPDSFVVAREGGVTGLRISLPTDSYFLKPGQVIELSTGERMESYEVPPATDAAPTVDLGESTTDSTSADTLPEQADPSTSDTVVPSVDINAALDALEMLRAREQVP